MCIPTNNISRGGGEWDDPAERGAAALTVVVPNPQEMAAIIEALRRGDSVQVVSSALNKLRQLSVCPAHAPLILQTPDAIPALVAVLRGLHERLATPLPATIRGAAGDCLRYFTDSTFHRVMPHDHPSFQQQDCIKGVVEAGGVQAALDVMVALLQSQELAEENVHIITACIHLLGSLSLHEPCLSISTLFDSMFKVVVQAMRRYNDNTRIVDFAILTLCMFVECHITPDIVLANRTKARELGVVELTVQAIEADMVSRDRVLIGFGTLFHLVNVGDGEGVYEQRNATARVLIECNGFETIVRGMRAHSNDTSIAEKGCGLFFRYGQADGVPDKAIESGGVQCVIDRMQAFHNNIQVQTMGCQALWNISRERDSIHKISSGTGFGGLKAVLKAMELYPDDTLLQEMAMGALWNPLQKNETIRRELAVMGGIELVGKGILTHKDHQGIQSEGWAPLVFASTSTSTEVSTAFLESPSAIPALLQVLQSIPHWSQVHLMTWDLANKHEQVSNAIGRLGLMEIDMIGGDIIGDDEYDGDDEDDEWCTVRNAPFDVGVLLDKDLASGVDVPGWFNAYPFHLAQEHSGKSEQHSGKEFFLSFKKPVIGQNVCLRTNIPFGGRGHLYGKITGVGLLPTDEELSNSDSRLYGKGCPCPSPTCKFQGICTRDQILALTSTLHGHEITAVVSLKLGDEFETEEKLRHPPLVPFFRGKKSKYQVTLRYNDRGPWEVVKITYLEEE